MSLGGIVFFLIMLALTAALVAAPLFRRANESQRRDLRLEKQQERLLAYYERVLNNLRDLDEDHATGKMPDEAYVEERETWVQRGVQVLKAIDSLEEASMVPASVHDDAALDEAIDSAIESAVAAYRGST
jgi:hypothetical protein